MQAYEGYVENGQFYPVGQDIRIQGRRRAFVTVLDEPVKSPKIEDDKAFWAEFDRMTAESSDENDLLLDEAFSRRAAGRELVTFDEGEKA